MQDQIIINNNLISYSQFGTGERAVLFLHGWRSSKEIWHQIIKLLHTNQIVQKTSFVALDFPGFGKSPLPPLLQIKDMNITRYAEVVRGLIDKLDLKQVVIIGHSFGGRVGIKFSSKYPELVKKLVLVDSAGFAMDPKKKSILKFMAKLVRPAFKPKAMQGIRRKIYKILGAEDYVATPEMQQIFLNVINEDLTDDMKKISIPTLVIWGEKDKATPVEFGRKMNVLIPNSQLELLKNAGHYSLIDQPEKFVNILSKFI